jgi:hypothetical protein
MPVANALAPELLMEFRDKLREVKVGRIIDRKKWQLTLLTKQLFFLFIKLSENASRRTF